MSTWAGLGGGFEVGISQAGGTPTAMVDREIMELIHRLPESQQQQVLQFARELAALKPHGIPGADLICFGGCIPADDLQRMRDAIEEGCEA